MKQGLDVFLLIAMLLMSEPLKAFTRLNPGGCRIELASTAREAATSESQKIQLRLGSVLKYSDDIATEARQNPGGLYLLNIYSNSAPPQKILGRIRLVSSPNGSNMLEVKDNRGLTHFLDLEATQVTLNKVTVDGDFSTWSDPLQATRSLLTYDPEGQARQELAKNVSSHRGSPFQSEEIYEFFRERPTETEALLKRWYPESDHGRPEVVARFHRTVVLAKEQLPAKFLPLFLDPGIASRAEDFLSFAKLELEKTPHQTPLSLRNAYSKKLGTKKIYRSLLLNSSEVLEIKKSGMSSTSHFNKENEAENLFKLFSIRAFNDAVISQASPSSAIYHRKGSVGLRHNSLLMSFSDYSDVAASVAYHSNETQRTNDRKLYTYEIEVPVLDVLVESDLHDPDRSRQQSHRLRVGLNHYQASDPGVEIFTWGSIMPEQIRQVTEVTEVPPSYDFER